MAIDTSTRIAGITSTITFGDSETVEVSFNQDGTISRWGNTDTVLGRAVTVTEALRDTLLARAGFGNVPEAGEQVTYIATVTNDEGVYPSDVELIAVLSADIDDSNLLVPLVPYTAASAFLEAWAAKSPTTRIYHSGEREDADIIVSWIHQGRIVLDVWPYTESSSGIDGFSLDVLVAGTLLTNTHYAIKEKRA